MEQIELVVKVPQKTINRIRSVYGHDKCYGLSDEDRKTVVEAIVNGTLLPKGHGDLVDLNSLDGLWNLDFYNPDSYYEFCTIMECGRILVEADEEGADDEGI